MLGDVGGGGGREDEASLLEGLDHGLDAFVGDEDVVGEIGGLEEDGAGRYQSSIGGGLGLGLERKFAGGMLLTCPPWREEMSIPVLSGRHLDLDHPLG